MKIKRTLGNEGEPWRDRDPTVRQINVLRENALKLGRGFRRPKTRGEASDQVAELIGDRCPECDGQGGFMSVADNADFDRCPWCHGTGRASKQEVDEKVVQMGAYEDGRDL